MASRITEMFNPTNIARKRGRTSQKELAKNNREIFTRIRGNSWKRWRTKQAKAYDFFLDDQLTRKELDDLTKAGMPTFTINKVTKSVEILQYFLTANNPRFTFIGREGSDVDLAAAHAALASYCWDISLGKSVFGNVIQNALVKSVGYFFVDIDPDADMGMGEVVFRSLETWDVFPDPASRDILLRDAGFILIKKDFTRRELKNRLPQYADKIDKISGHDEHTITYSDRDASRSGSVQREDISSMIGHSHDDEFLDYYEMYTRERVPYVRVTVRDKPTNDQLDELKARVDSEIKIIAGRLETDIRDSEIAIKDALRKDEISEERAEFEIGKMRDEAKKALSEQRDQMISEGVAALTQVRTFAVSEDEFKTLKKSKEYKDRIASNVTFWQTKVKVVRSIGSDTYIDEYYLPSTYYPIVRVPYLDTGTPYPMSLVQMNVGQQQETNKSHQIMIHNASLGSSLRYKLKRGSGLSAEEVEKRVTVPGAVIEVDEMDALQEILPAQLSSAFLEITERSGSTIEENMGALPQMGGDVRATPGEPFRTRLIMDEASTRRLRSWLTNVVEPALEQLGRVFTEYAQAVYSAHKVFRIVEPDTQESEEYSINVPIYDRYGSVIGKYNSYESLRFDVKIVSGSTLPSNRHAELQEYRDLYKEGIVDDIAVLEKTDVKNKERILQRKSVVAQLQSQVESMQEALKDKDGDIETLKRQIMQAGIRDGTKEVTVEFRKAMADFKAELRAIAAEQRQKSATAVKSAAMELEKAATKGKSEK